MVGDSAPEPLEGSGRDGLPVLTVTQEHVDGRGDLIANRADMAIGKCGIEAVAKTPPR